MSAPMTKRGASGSSRVGARVRTVVRGRQHGGWSLAGVLVPTAQLLLGVLVIALPLTSGRSAAVLVAAICLPALVAMLARPQGPWVTFVLVGGVLEWLVTTLLVASPSTLRVCIFAVLLCWLHRVGALAAVLPQGVGLDRVAAARWLVRTLVLTVVSVPVMLAILLLPRPAQGTLWLGLVGAVAIVGVLALVGVLLRRPQA